jgi:hypothetical protein
MTLFKFSKLKKVTNATQSKLPFFLHRCIKDNVSLRIPITTIILKGVICAIFAFAIIAVPCFVEGFQVVLRDKGTESDFCSFVVDDVYFENVENGIIILSGKVIETVLVKKPFGFDESSPEFSGSDVKLLPFVDADSRPVSNKSTNEGSDDYSNKSDYSVTHHYLLQIGAIILGLPLGIICLFVVLFIIDRDNIKYLFRELYGNVAFFFKEKIGRSPRL